MFKCKKCSRSYAWEQSLKRHIKQDHGEESTEDEETGRETTDDSEDSDSGSAPAAKSRRLNSRAVIDDDNEDDEAIWITIVGKIVNEHQLQYDEKLQQISNADGTERVEEEMRPLYKRALKNFITEQIIRENHLQHSKYYTKLMHDFRAFIKRFPKQTLWRAVRATLRKNDSLLDDMLDDFDDNIRRYSLNDNQQNYPDSAEGH